MPETNRSARDVARLLLCTLIVAAAGPADAQQALEEPPPSRPRIGLVLGGGGAKGTAHIGVLRVLDELRIPIDCIAGTSMGALVGGTLAAGRSPEEIERDVRAIDWGAAVGGQGQRDRTPINRKLDEIAYANPLEVGVVDGRLSTAGGFIQTQAIEQQIRGLVADARLTENFDELPVPFRAVATDMVSGETVVLGDGDLSIAMRASMAIPGAFSPVRIDDLVLADGGLLHNLPVDVARDVCADVVIAVWLETPRATPDELGSALSLVARSLDVVIRANERTQIATLTDADVGIAVQMGDITTTDFDRAPEAIDLGRAAADRNRDALSRYSVSEAEYAAWVESVRRRRVDSNYVSDVSVVGLDRVNPAFIASQLRNVAPGEEVTTDELEADADRLFALGDFEQVEYRLTGSPDARVLEVRPIEKSWGPDFFRLNIGAATDGDGDIFGILRVDHTRTWINDRGGEWRNTFQVGGRSMLTSRLYQPLDTHHRFFVEPYVQLENERHDIYLDGDRWARYFVRQLFTEIDAGINIGTHAQLRAGIRRGWIEADLDTGIPGFPELDPEIDTSLQLRATYDTRDSVGLPTRGTFVSTRYVHSDDWWDGKQDYKLLEGVVSHSFSFRGNSLSVTAAGGRALDGDPPITQSFRLGGIRTFPGLKPGELRSDNYWFAGATYLWRLVDSQPLSNGALFAGLRFQAGEARDRFDEIDDGTLYGLSGSVSGGTPIGPFTLSLGFVSNGSALIQFTLGRPIAEGSILDELQ